MRPRDLKRGLRGPSCPFPGPSRSCEGKQARRENELFTFTAPGSRELAMFCRIVEISLLIGDCHAESNYREY
jgi:hypothetical protein